LEPQTPQSSPLPEASAAGVPAPYGGWLAAAVVVAVAIRWLRWESTAVLFNDGPVFLALARAAAAGDWASLLAHPFHPLYPLATAAVHAMGSPIGLGWESAGALTSALAGGGAVLALYAFVRRAFGPLEGIVAASLLALHATAIEQSGDVQSEGLYLAFFLASSAALWTALAERRARAAFVAGLASGLAYLTRPEGLSLALVGGGIALGLFALRHWTWRSTLTWGLALGFGALLCVAPYVGALWWESGEFWLTRKKSVAWVAGIDGPPRHFSGAPTVEPDWNRLSLPAGVETPGRRGAALHEADKSLHPRLRAERERAEAIRTGVVPPLLERAGTAGLDLLRTSWRTLRYEVLLLLLLGLLGSRSDGLRARPGLRAAFVGSVLGFHGLMLFGLALNVGYVSSRHVLPPLMLLLGYAAVSIPVLTRMLDSRLGQPRPAAIVLALVLVGGVGMAKNLRPEGRDELAERRAAEWLRENAEPPGPVATRKRRVAYYAELPFVQLRDKPLGRFVHYLDTHDVRYVVLNTRDIVDYEGLEPLLGSWLEKLHEVETEGESAWVLRYAPPHREGAAPRDEGAAP